MSEQVADRVRELVQGPIAGLGCELADINLSHYKSTWTVRLFVYAEGGVDIDLCARLSRAVGDLIDGTDLFEAGYTLEVSSPGLDRPLTRGIDFRYRVGEQVRITFKDRQREPVEAAIVSANETEAQFEGTDGPFSVPLGEIEKAVIIF